MGVCVSVSSSLEIFDVNGECVYFGLEGLMRTDRRGGGGLEKYGSYCGFGFFLFFV